MLEDFLVEDKALPLGRVSNPNETQEAPSVDVDTEPSRRSYGDPMFHNPREPQVDIQTERPEHRAVLILKMQGLTNIDISKRTGYTPVHIATIVKQPWAQRYMSSNMHEMGMDQVILTLRGAARKAALRLEREIDNMDAKPAERISAAKIVVQQIYGAATQTVTVNREPEKMSDAEVNARIRELQQLQASRS